MRQKKILSTRILSEKQRSILTENGFSVLEKDFIEISYLDFQIKRMPDILLFTSQNAVKSILKSKDRSAIQNLPALCVGSKTKALLEANHFNVVHDTNYASELATYISQHFKQDFFAFFAGNRRMDTLPNTFAEQAIPFDEYQVYQTTLTPQKITESVDGILFYSPSGVQSFLIKNKISTEVCVCIGTTTAAALSDVSKQIEVAEEQTVEGTILKSIVYFKNQLVFKRTDGEIHRTSVNTDDKK